ncbi:hypothetical protein [Actinoallomurus acaciae]|uniref:Uncharacterized protein n=1 Tax=Actinoallomurus acaciae TaxID=502577 RepID=A0ABV5YR54_9ACTN
MRTVEPEQAQEEAERLIRGLDGAELRRHENALRNMIGHFLKKRKRALTEELERLLAASAEGVTVKARLVIAPPRRDPAVPPKDEPPETHTSESVNDKLAQFTRSLDQLAQHRIFQWSTDYRQQLSSYFDWFFGVTDRASLGGDIQQRIAHHSREIFQKGFDYLQEQGELVDYAVAKSINGLQAFLDLPIEFYSAKLPLASDVRTARRLRALTSAMLTGILDGYTDMEFGEAVGGQILPRYGRSWGHALAFLTAADLEYLVSKIEVGDFRDGVSNNVVPLVEALDKIGKGRSHAPLPALSQFLWSHAERRLEISLRPSSLASNQQLIQIQCHFQFIDRAALDEASTRNVTLLIGPARGDLRTFINTSRHLRDITVTTDGDPATTETAREAILSTLNFRSYRQGTRSALSQPLSHNHARDFPLDRPRLLRFAHVYRQSVQDLLRTFDRRNGVRLWCSVRRSGKTTAGLDLGSTTARSTVITQTCETAGAASSDGEFFAGVTAALDEGRRIPKTFLSDLIARCGVLRQGDGDRIVFVLDEYETLFGEFRRALRIEPDIRYPVIQPLLNQMVGFSHDNLLVFLGQQPDAHHILMDQNQLSPYVRQDPFPLFFHEHGDASEEFTQFVAKVLANRMDFEPSFTDGLFRETSGHPFLTVKLLIDLVDWLIDIGRPAAGLRLTGEDMAEFAKVRLRKERFNMIREYVFFRKAAAEAMSALGREQTPWLHAVYVCLSEIGRSSPQTLTCTRGDFRGIAEDVTQRMSEDPDLLLSSGAQSNFFVFDEDTVRPRIPLLCRIAAISRGKTSA